MPRAEPVAVGALPLRGGLRYFDTGKLDHRPVVFFGGLGTSAFAPSLAEVAAPGLRERLGLRLICVERNGFGLTSFDSHLGFPEAVQDVLAVLSVLEVQRLSIVAISGGGPYAARLADRLGPRVASLHLACAVADGSLLAGSPAADWLRDPQRTAADPEAFWEFPSSSEVRSIPGFLSEAAAEGRRAFPDPVRGGLALAHEWQLLCSEPLPHLRRVAAPGFLYWGARDEIVGIEHAQAWSRALGGATSLRVYPDAGHDVQYLHWDQVLHDLAEAWK